MSDLRKKMYEKYVFYKNENTKTAKEISELIQEENKIISKIKSKKRAAKLLKNAKISFTDFNKVIYVQTIRTKQTNT
jgi:hypothetical protein